MINPQLLEYVRQQMKAGVKKEEIEKSIATQGWNKQDANEIFLHLETKKPGIFLGIFYLILGIGTLVFIPMAAFCADNPNAASNTVALCALTILSFPTFFFVSSFVLLTTRTGVQTHGKVVARYVFSLLPLVVPSVILLLTLTAR